MFDSQPWLCLPISKSILAAILLRVHFLNVGHGDCTIIEHPSGRLTMIDVNNSQEFDAETFAQELAEERRKLQAGNPLANAGIGMLAGVGTGVGTSQMGSLFAPTPTLLSGLGDLSGYTEVYARQKRELTDPIEFMKTNYPNRGLWRFVLTHPDLDHMRGLKRLSENVGFANFWDTKHTKETPTFRSNSADEEDWKFYQSLRSANAGKCYTRGDSLYAFGKEEDGRPGGDNIEILSPTPELIGACNTAQKSNDVSLVLRVHHAGRSILLPGDAEELAWDGMVDFYGARLKSDFLKAGHHGRDTGYHQSAVKLIAPELTIVSVGMKPDTDASNKYRQQTGKRVPSTRYHGNIKIEIDDNGTWRWFVDQNPG
ncbi:ComEC/Rec2 family competence protein [Bradyrhizobium lablabi]|uniref:ComEC/Rec2 family competence protein n=1 Tax=Bradyrhizobium lablabi TaxID=722472 RepID=UPI0012ABD3A3|nr:MBL fold metallo-hydrolase [Bradyrhizobium lablabi]